jgi:hypothetical protein
LKGCKTPRTHGISKGPEPDSKLRTGKDVVTFVKDSIRIPPGPKVDLAPSGPKISRKGIAVNKSGFVNARARVGRHTPQPALPTVQYA